MVYLDQELAGLKNTLLTMASYAESAVKQAVEAVLQRDVDLAERVRDGDSVIDRFEVDVDETAVRLLAKAPLASDLRFIAVTMKISQNLERVGDEATKIAKSGRELSHEPPLKQVADVAPLAELAVQMLNRALDAFVHRDPAAARALIPQDKQVDAMNREIHQRLADQMIRDPETIPRCLHLMVVAKSLERIADHAKNVAEEVVFLCEAEDIRHTGKARSARTGSTGE